MSTFPVGVVGVCFSHFFMCFTRGGGDWLLSALAGCPQGKKSPLYTITFMFLVLYMLCYTIKKLQKNSYLLKLYFVDINLQCTGKNLIYLI